MAGRLPRQTAWATTAEWLSVHRLLFEHPSGDGRREACEAMAAWAARGARLPLGVESTLGVMHVQLQDEGGECDDFSLRLLYSATIVRFVNGMCDAGQKTAQAKSVQAIASSLKIPEVLVDVRHQATHTALPSLATLRAVTPLALQWLRERYWARQVQHLEGLPADIRAALERYRDVKFGSVKARPGHESQKAVSHLHELNAILSANTIRTGLIPALLSEGILLPKFRPGHTKRDQAVAVWKPALAFLCSEWEGFGVQFLTAVLSLRPSPPALEWAALWFSTVDAAVCPSTTDSLALARVCLQHPSAGSPQFLDILLRPMMGARGRVARLGAQLGAWVDVLTNLSQLAHAEEEGGAGPPSDPAFEGSAELQALRTALSSLGEQATPEPRPSVTHTAAWQRQTDARWKGLALGLCPGQKEPCLDYQPEALTPAAATETRKRTVGTEEQLAHTITKRRTLASNHSGMGEEDYGNDTHPVAALTQHELGLREKLVLW